MKVATLLYCFFSGCGHCKKAKPEFTEAAEQFKDDSKVGFTDMKEVFVAK